MSEHDDDLESIVHEEAQEETDTYPDTADELEVGRDAADEDDEEPNLNDDEAEL